MLLPRTDAGVGAGAPYLPVEQPALGRGGVRLLGGHVEPVVPADALVAAVGNQVEHLRPLLPVGYAAGAAAYRAAVADLTARDLTTHYTAGLGWFRGEFVPRLKQTLHELSGGAWDLSDFEAFAAGSDVDFMAHLVEAAAVREGVSVYPGDWYGFRVGSTHPEKVCWSADARGRLACLCVPSVRNGHLTAEMVEFLGGAGACLLNLNLFPTLPPAERKATAEALAPVLGKSVLSISFSRGFGLTASQLGVALVPRGHPYRTRYAPAWEWFTYFFNGIAAKAFMALDLGEVARVDGERRAWVADWLRSHGLPAVESGSYYVKAFRPDGDLPDAFAPLLRDGLVRLCFKPPAC